MSETETVPGQKLGEPGERCVECETPLAPDQRYCLHCGRRRGPVRVPFREHVGALEGGDPPTVLSPPPPSAEPPPSSSRLGAGAFAAGAAVLLLALGVGAVLGHAITKTPKAAKPAAAPVVRVNIPATTVLAAPAAAAPAAATFTSDWPSTHSGWAVQLQTLDKTASDPAAVTAAKTAATGQGATAVGALDSDNFSSLPSGQYVVYSGDFPSKAKAKTALKALKAKFPGAKVVHVTGGGSAASTIAGAPKAGSNPSQYEKQAKKVKKPISTGGTPPPKDKKKAGGGSPSTTIG